MEEWNNGRRIGVAGPQNAECGLRNEEGQETGVKDERRETREEERKKP